jgi:hypothetical protein
MIIILSYIVIIACHQQVMAVIALLLEIAIQLRLVM